MGKAWMRYVCWIVVLSGWTSMASGQITGITATASTEWEAWPGGHGYRAQNTVDGSGMTGDLCSNVTYPNKMWGTANWQLTGWIKFDLGAKHGLTRMRLWNANETGYTGVGVKTADILVSPTGVGTVGEGMGDWTVLIPDCTFTKAPGTNGYVTIDDIPLNEVTRYIGIACKENYGSTVRIGFGEVEFYGVLLDQASAVTGITATASTEWEAWPGGHGYRAQNTVDGSGMTGDLCSNVTYPNKMWGTANWQLTGWIKFDLGTSQKLSWMSLWNANETGYTGVGVKTADILVSPTGVGEVGDGMGDWTVLIPDCTFTKAPGTNGYVTTDDILLNATARYVGLMCEENHGSSVRIGFGEARFYGEKAYQASPSVGAVSYTTIPMDPQGDFVLRLNVPGTSHAGLSAESFAQTLTIPMSGADRSIEASIDLRWQDLPTPLPSRAQRSWGYTFYVGTNATTGTFMYPWSGSEFAVSADDFTRITQTFTLPHLAQDPSTGGYVEITEWELYEDHTIELTDGTTPFDACVVDVDNITLRELQSGPNLNYNGAIVGTPAGWTMGSYPGTLSLLTIPSSLPVHTYVAVPSPGTATYTSVSLDQGGYAMRYAVPATTQTRLLPMPDARRVKVDMNGSDKTMVSSMDMRWQQLPSPLPTGRNRYWDCQFYVGSEITACVLSLPWDWSEFSASTGAFTRFSQTFTLPHLAYDTTTSNYVEISSWTLTENRTLQLHDPGGFSSCTVDVDNISLGEYPDGANLNMNGTIQGTLSGWEGWHALSLVALPSQTPPQALTAMTRRAVMDEPRLNQNAFVHHTERLAVWLESNGFERLDGYAIADWMRDRINETNAYGSVVVVSRGLVPEAFVGFEGKDVPLWYDYIYHGGRLVHAGGIPIYSESVAGEAATGPVNSLFNINPLLATAEQWGSGIYWNLNNPAATLTADGTNWGFEMSDSSSRGLRVDAATLVFSSFTPVGASMAGAASWFRNVNASMPSSGLIKLRQYADYNVDAELRQIWRAANYVGSTLTPPTNYPPIVTTTPPLTIDTFAGGMDGRREYVRGEVVALDVTVQASLYATSVALTLSETNGTPLWSEDVLVSNNVASFILDTAPYAYGPYLLTATALSGTTPQGSVTETHGIRYSPPATFGLEMYLNSQTHALRAETVDRVIAGAGMEVHAPNLDAAFVVDAIVRNNIGFSARTQPDLWMGIVADPTTHPEYFRRGPDGEFVLSGGVPLLGLTHPDILENSVLPVATVLEMALDLPSFRHTAFCNDDFNLWYGWDYQSRVTDEFTVDTGLTAPTNMTLPNAYGPVADTNAWVSWLRWTVLNVAGFYNQAVKEAALGVDADIVIGPIPAPGNHPFVSMWSAAQYPTYNFGSDGLNMVSSYFYNAFEYPPFIATYWMQVGRMGHRGLSQWQTADMWFTAATYRNHLFHYLAGGVDGLAYFTYDWRRQAAWDECLRLAPVLRRVGPVQTQLEPATPRIGLLNSFTTHCFDPNQSLSLAYAYMNLMQAHFSVEPVAEEELVAGRADQYEAILLHDVDYIGQSASDALTTFMNGGGTVLLDNTIPFYLPGAIRINVSLGHGWVTAVGPLLFGSSNIVEAVQTAVSPYVAPDFLCSDLELVATPFTVGSVNYTWFVDSMNQSDYGVCRQMQAILTLRDELITWEAARLAQGPYQPTVTFADYPGVPYDLVRGTQLDVTATSAGYEVPLSMDWAGGSLVAWLPSEITSLTSGGPTTAAYGSSASFTASLWMGSTPAPGALPIQFTLVDPTGRTNILSQVVATTNGTATLEWSPAVNDVQGTWALAIDDLASGRKTVRTIDL